MQGLDEVWLVVNAQIEAHDSFKDGAAPLGHRLEMARLAVQNESKVRVYEGTLADALHSWPAFEELARQEGLREPFFILGMDAFMRLDRWDDVESVVKKATFTVARRGDSGGREVGELRRRLGGLAGELRVREFSFDGFGNVSSSRVKANLRDGVRPAGLDPRVLDYILANKLYV
jgi:nicotinic acid mononucleotide adenylyltransferase